MTESLLPIMAGTVVALAALAFVLYLWTWVRYVGVPEEAARAEGGRRQQPCAGCPVAA